MSEGPQPQCASARNLHRRATQLLGQPVGFHASEEMFKLAEEVQSAFEGFLSLVEAVEVPYGELRAAHDKYHALIDQSKALLEKYA
jgi:hypothetical protein